MDEPAKLLASLEERVKRQVAMEHHETEDAEWAYENMTVAELLRMLSYILEMGA